MFKNSKEIKNKEELKQVVGSTLEDIFCWGYEDIRIETKFGGEVSSPEVGKYLEWFQQFWENLPTRNYSFKDDDLELTAHAYRCDRRGLFISRLEDVEEIDLYPKLLSTTDENHIWKFMEEVYVVCFLPLESIEELVGDVIEVFGAITKAPLINFKEVYEVLSEEILIIIDKIRLLRKLCHKPASIKEFKSKHE